MSGACLPVHHAQRSATGAKRTTKQSGFTLVEMLIALGLAAILFAGLNGVIGLGLASYQTTTGKNELTRQARFAMDQMVNAVNRGPRLMGLWQSLSHGPGQVRP